MHAGLKHLLNIYKLLAHALSFIKLYFQLLLRVKDVVNNFLYIYISTQYYMIVQSVRFPAIGRLIWIFLELLKYVSFSEITCLKLPL